MSGTRQTTFIRSTTSTRDLLRVSSMTPRSHQTTYAGKCHASVVTMHRCRCVCLRVAYSASLSTCLSF